MQRLAVQTGDVPALRKGLSVLELLSASGPLTLTEIQHRGGLNKTMAFRIMRVLRETEYVRHDAGNHQFSLTHKLLTLGGTASSRLDIVAVAQPRLDALQARFDETVNLGVVEHGRVIYLAIAESNRRGLRMASFVGGRDHVHSTSIGKATLAFLPESEQEELLTTVSRPPVTERTLTGLDELRSDLARARARGFAIDDEENEIGARCVGVPVLSGGGRPIAAISISGPVGRIQGETIDRIAASLWTASRAISTQLGHTHDQSQPGGAAIDVDRLDDVSERLPRSRPDEP